VPDATTSTGPELPPRLLPVLYFATAHAALVTAFAALTIDPRAFSGFFYHARMLAAVHLVTLGWITMSILGSLYIVGPAALRMRLRARRADYAAFALAAGGVVGMTGHFWIGAYSGMAWSALLVVAGVLVVGWRTITAMRATALPWAIRMHLVLAFANIAAAGTLGILIGFDKVYHFLPGFVLTNVFAHAHLAAIGWASMMVVGVAYRLLPMVLPAQMPSGPRLWMSAVLLEAGVVGLFVDLLRQGRAGWIFALLIAAGFAAFLSQVVWMRRHPRSRPPGLPTPDPAVLHAAMAFLWLVVAAGLGIWLTLVPQSETSLRIATIYGVVGLVGFLAQMVVGMEGRLLPLFAWYWAYANTNYKGPVPPPQEMPWRAAQDVVFVLWVAAVPALASALAFDSAITVRAAAGCLLLATVLDSISVGKIFMYAFRRGRPL
jgi:hypothetical protein